jgi:hypothetical protein
MYDSVRYFRQDFSFLVFISCTQSTNLVVHDNCEKVHQQKKLRMVFILCYLGTMEATSQKSIARYHWRMMFILCCRRWSKKRCHLTCFYSFLFEFRSNHQKCLWWFTFCLCNSITTTIMTWSEIWKLALEHAHIALKIPHFKVQWFLKLEYMLKIIWSKPKFENLNTQAHFHLSKSNTFGFPHITLQCDDFHLIFNSKLLIAIAITSRCLKTFVEWHTPKNIKWYNWFSSNCCILKIWKWRTCSLIIHSLGKTTRATRWLGWIDALHIQILNTLITKNKQIWCLVQFEPKLNLRIILNSHAFHHDLNQFI